MNEEQLCHCRDVISSCNEIMSAHNKSIFEQIPYILFSWTRLKNDVNEKNRTNGHLFNPFSIIKIGETTHSRLLGDLLNPKGHHSQGNLFLESFLKLIEVPYAEMGEWTISIESGSVDICLRRSSPPSVILIENKSNWAVDQQNQLYRYWYENIYKFYPQNNYSNIEVKNSFQLVYLPPGVEKRPEPHALERPQFPNNDIFPKDLEEAGVKVRLFTFRQDITKWLDSCNQLIPSTNIRLKTHLQFYKELWH